MVIKGKTKELLAKQLKTCEKKMQELIDSIKRPNLRIMGIEEGEEVQAKGMCNIFNKIITENFQNLEKSMLIQVQEASRTPNRPDQNRTTPQHIIIKTTSTETRERIFKAVREKKQITYKGKPIKITADFSTKTLKARRVQEIIRYYYENLYSNTCKNLKEMDRFLDTYDHPKLNQEDVNHLNRSITQNEIEAAIKSLPKTREHTREG
jgi:hypothetical protein